MSTPKRTIIRPVATPAPAQAPSAAAERPSVTQAARKSTAPALVPTASSGETLADQLRRRIQAHRQQVSFNAALSTPGDRGAVVTVPQHGGGAVETDEQRFDRIYNDPSCWVGSRLRV